MGPFALTAEDRRLYVDPDDLRAQHLIASAGGFNAGSLELWRLAVAAYDWQVVVDVGVNYAEMLVGVELPRAASVIGFEPNVALHPYIRRTCAEHSIAVDLRAEAVSDRRGRARFAVDRRWSGTSTLGPAETADSPIEAEQWRLVDVETITLDEVVGAGRSWCAKVDVEGWEPQVLAGAARALHGPAPWALMLELLHLSPSYIAGLAAEHVLLLLDRRTQRLVWVPGGNRSLAERMLTCGWLYDQDGLLVSAEVAAALESS